MRTSGGDGTLTWTPTTNNSRYMTRSQCDGRSCSYSPQLPPVKSRTPKSGGVESRLAFHGDSAESSSRSSAKGVHFHHHHHHHNHHRNQIIGNQEDISSFVSDRSETNTRNGGSKTQRASRSRSSSVSASTSLDDSSIVLDQILRRDQTTSYHLFSESSSSSVVSSHQGYLSRYEGKTDLNRNYSGFVEDSRFERSSSINATCSSPARLTGNGGSEEHRVDTLDRSADKSSDYSYSKSFDYVSGVTPSRPCPNPNMTREKGYINSTCSTNSTSTRTNGSVGGRFHGHYIVRNSFGLDSESEDEFGNQLNSKTAKQSWRLQQQQQSTFSQISTSLLAIKDYVISSPVGTLSLKLFLLSYCFFSSVYLFDTWLLLCIRSFTQKRANLFFWVVPLLVMFLLFGAGRYFPGEYAKMPIHPFSSQHLNKTLQQTSYFASGFSSARDFLSGLSSWFVLHGDGKLEPAPTFDRDKSQKINRHLSLDQSDSHEINQPLTLNRLESKDSQQLTSDHLEIEPKLTSHNLSIESHSRILSMIKEELAKTRMSDKSDSEHKTKEQIDLYSRLEGLLSRLEEKVVKLENAHEALSINIRNCCRNHTEHSKIIELQIAQAFNKILVDDDEGSADGDVKEADGEFKWRLDNFKNWITAQFVSKDNLDDEIARRGTIGLTENMRLEIEALSKAVATAVVTKHLESYESSTLKSSQSTAESDPSAKSTEEATVVSVVDEAFVRGVVHNVLSVYNADKTGMADFAMETAGGSVVSTRCSETYQPRTAQYFIFGFPLWFVAQSPRTVIQSGVQPGECWAFKGSQGYIVIQLATTVKPTAFSIEHIPQSLSTTGNIDSAPREFSVLGLQYVQDTNGVLLGKYTFDINGEPLQFFIVKDQDVGSFPFIELQIESNHGNPEFTCLYRFRVHGVVQNT